MNLNRRDFFRSTAWMGAMAMAAGCIGNRFKMFEPCGAPMQGFALKPMKKVRVACIGVGVRGRAALRRIATLPGTEVAAVADLFQDRVDTEIKWLKAHKKPAPAIAVAGPEGYKRICDSDKVDVIYNVTPWHLHEPIARYAMEHGKVVLNEVPGNVAILRSAARPLTPTPIHATRTFFIGLSAKPCIGAPHGSNILNLFPIHPAAIASAPIQAVDLKKSLLLTFIPAISCLCFHP